MIYICIYNIYTNIYHIYWFSADLFWQDLCGEEWAVILLHIIFVSENTKAKEACTT